jgi:hypothetical protein
MSYVTHDSTYARPAMGNAVCTTGLGTSFSIKLYTASATFSGVTISNGTATVSGSGFTGLSAGQVVFFTEDTTSTPYVVSSSTSTSVILTANYTGASISGGHLEVTPLNADTSIGSATAAATITGVQFAASSLGTSQINSSTADSNAVGGTVRFGRMIAGTGGTPGLTVQFVITPTGKGGDMQMNTVVIGGSAAVALAGTNTYAAAP